MINLQNLYSGNSIERALEGYRDFAKEHSWPVEDKVRLYRLCGEAFAPNLTGEQQMQLLETAYNELHRKWQIFRPAVPGSYWSAAEVHQALSILPVECSRGGTLTLPGIISTRDTDTLLKCIKIMKGVKNLPTHRTPIMAISKFLHCYNPRLFPIFDGAVIQQTVLRVFKDEWRSFPEPALEWEVPTEQRDYLKYMFWAASLLQGHERVLSGTFSQWLKEQLGREGANEALPSDCQEWYATAFEFIAIGAMGLQ